jgi:hypothetical protein|tara:strand:- start:1387 stop:2202 length:816 start_codon:yes stop_codon:yes gene_type:complete
MLFFTFCVDIGKHSRSTLVNTLLMMLKSIHNKIPDYTIICFTNFTIKNKNNYNIQFRRYYNRRLKLYKNEWLNLSFNKINIYKDLYDEFKRDFIWIDLDTIVTYDISYLNMLTNVFIETGGECQERWELFHNSTISVPTHKYVQGNFWKLNIAMYNVLMQTLRELINKNLKMRFDLQDLFNYYIFIQDNGELKNINILGNNIRKNTINGLGIWSENRTVLLHANVNGLNNLYYDNKQLKTRFYNKEIHLVSFTFDTLKKLQNNNQFNKLFN